MLLLIMENCKCLFVLPESAFERIYGSELFDEVSLSAEVLAPRLNLEQLLERTDLASRTEVLFTGWGAPVLTGELLDTMPELKLVLYGAGSIKGVVTDEFWEREIPICSAAPINAIPVAEYAFAQIILALKNTFQQQAHCRAEKAMKHLPMAGCYGSSVGIISLGEIGRRVCRYLRPLDVKVYAYDPFAPESLFQELGIHRSHSLEDLFKESDVVSLHAPNIPETKGMIGRSHFESMKPSATFINTARGDLIRETEMVNALQKRPDITALLDVLANQDQGNDPRIWTTPNIWITPHIAGSIGLECRRMGRAMVTELTRYRTGESLHLMVSKDQIQYMS